MGGLLRAIMLSFLRSADEITGANKRHMICFDSTDAFRGPSRIDQSTFVTFYITLCKAAPVGVLGRAMVLTFLRPVDEINRNREMPYDLL